MVIHNDAMRARALFETRAALGIVQSMSRTHATMPTWITRQMCLGCGYDGRELQSGQDEITYNCPSCGHDLYARPPMSYAQMEGLAQPPRVVQVRHIHPVVNPTAIATLDRRIKRVETAVVWSMGVLLMAIVVAGILDHVTR